MVTSVTSLGRNGLYDWLIQRISAIVIAVYVIFLAIFFIVNPDLQYAQWRDLHAALAMRIFNLITLLCLVSHAWIGLWGVLTDYVTTRMMGASATFIRIVLQLGMIAALIVMLLIGIDIFWS